MTPGLPHVHLWDFSRLSFVNTVLSKRKLTWFVDNGKVRAAPGGCQPSDVSHAYDSHTDQGESAVVPAA